MAKWGQGTVYKRGKTYWIKYYQNGKPYYESAKSDKYADASRLLAERMGDVAKGKPAGLRFDKVMLSELIQDLKDFYKHKERKTRPRIKRIKEFFGNYRVVDVTSSAVTQFINSRKEQGAANGTINRDLAALRKMLNLGAKASPPKVDRVLLIEDLPEAEPKDNFFEDEDFYALLENLPEHIRSIAGFAYWTGWRLGQIRKLEWSMVNLKEREINAPGKITKNKEPHKIYMAEPLYDIIMDQHNKRNLGCRYVFHREGKQVKDIRFSWNVACRDAGLGYGYKLNKKYAETWERRNLQVGPTVHDFRRTAVRNLIRAGVPQSIAKKITGHKTDAVFERYNITDRKDLQRAAELQAEANSYKNGYKSSKPAKRVAV
jgi:integrase